MIAGLARRRTLCLSKSNSSSWSSRKEPLPAQENGPRVGSRFFWSEDRIVSRHALVRASARVIGPPKWLIGIVKSAQANGSRLLRNAMVRALREGGGRDPHFQDHRAKKKRGLRNVVARPIVRALE